jgi:hypothetical protein
MAFAAIAVMAISFASPAKADSYTYVKNDGIIADHSGDGAWCWFQDPRAVHHVGEYNKTYIGYVTSSGNIIVSSREEGTGVGESYRLATSFQRDDHASPGIVVLPDGRIAVFYAKHNDQYMRFRVSTRAEDITSFGPEQQTGAPVGGGGVTYANPVYLPSENRVYVFFRGDNALPQVIWSDPSLQNWSKPQTFIVPADRYPSQRPYVKYSTNGTDTISMTFTDGHPKEQTHTAVYYMQLKNGEFRTIRGKKVGQLGSFSGAGLDQVRTNEVPNIYHPLGMHAGSAWVWSTALDSQGYPVVAFASFPSLNDHRYWYARWDGTRWQLAQVTTAGAGSMAETPQEPQYSGGIELDQNDPSTMYLSRKVVGQWEVQQWQTPDEGKTFRKVADLSQKSRDKNVRPVVPWGPPSELKVLWMNGYYRSWSPGAFNTSIRSYTKGRAVTTVDARISRVVALKGQLVTISAKTRQGFGGAGMPHGMTRLVRLNTDGSTAQIATKQANINGDVSYLVRADGDARYEVRLDQHQRYAGSSSNSVAYQQWHNTQARISLRTDTVNKRIRLFGRAVDTTTGKNIPYARMEFWQSVNGGAWTRRTSVVGDSQGLASALLSVPDNTRVQVRVNRQGIHLWAHSEVLHSGIGNKA